MQQVLAAEATKEAIVPYMKMFQSLLRFFFSSMPPA